jgi:hypothetical protein
MGNKSAFQNLFACTNYAPKNEYTKQVLSRIHHCHTKDLGYHCYQCSNEECLHSHTQYHSCGNRHCPFCGTLKKDKWVEDRLADLLPTPYYHIVFTVPHSWNRVMMQSPKELYSILFDAASETLLNLGKNPNYMGATPGITAVLHTWGQQLDYHVHLHCVVSGGGVNEGQWVAAKRAKGNFLFPWSPLRTTYKAIFLRLARERKQDIAASDEQIDTAIRESGYKKWKVYAKAPFGGPDQVLKYLGRYTHKTAITSYRIEAVENGTVRFSYKDYADGNKIKSMVLEEKEFLQRFERHILPKRFVRIRHYGFLTNKGKVTRLNQIRETLGLEQAKAPVEIPVAVRLLEKYGTDITRCTKCASGRYELLLTKRFGKTTYRKPQKVLV